MRRIPLVPMVLVALFAVTSSVAAAAAESVTYFEDWSDTESWVQRLDKKCLKAKHERLLGKCKQQVMLHGADLASDNDLYVSGGLAARLHKPKPGTDASYQASIAFDIDGTRWLSLGIADGVVFSVVDGVTRFHGTASGLNTATISYSGNDERVSLYLNGARVRQEKVDLPDGIAHVALLCGALDPTNARSKQKAFCEFSPLTISGYVN